MSYPDSREKSDTARLCPFCGRGFIGFRGLKIHLGQKVGQGVHPDDAKDIEKSDAPIAHVDDDMNVIELVEENLLMPSTKRRLLDDEEVISKKVKEFINEIEEDGYGEVAETARSKLL